MNDDAGELLPLSYVNQYAYCARRFWYMYAQGEMKENAHVLRGVTVHRRVYVYSATLGLSDYCDLEEEAADGTFAPSDAHTCLSRVVLILALNQYPFDVSMGEDVAEVRIGHAPQALAAFRNTSSSALRLDRWAYVPTPFAISPMMASCFVLHRRSRKMK